MTAPTPFQRVIWVKRPHITFLVSRLDTKGFYLKRETWGKGHEEYGPQPFALWGKEIIASTVPAVDYKCPFHRTEFLVDEQLEDGTVVPGALCPKCEPLECVNFVRALYRRKA